MQVIITSLFVCAILVLVLRKFAHRLDMIDFPDRRKQHRNPTPMVGGLAMFVAVLVALISVDALHQSVALLIGMAALLLTLGVLDDKHGLSASFRLMIQVFIVVTVVTRAGGTVTHLGALLGSDIELELFAVPFSVIAFVGGINAINMIDGADGMAGKMALITTLGVAIIFYISGATHWLPLTYAMIGALIGFLLLNSRIFVKRAWVFMGDAGSMWLGLVLGWFMAQVTRGVISAEPPIVLWLFGIPLIDTLVVMTRRIKRKQSPFAADRTHIHHVFEHAGFSVRNTVLILSLVQLVLVAIGVLFYFTHASSFVVFWSFVLLMGLYYYWLRNYEESKYARITE